MKSFLPLIQSEWRLLLFGFAMAFGSSLGQTYFIGLFSGEIRLDLGLSHGAFGGVYSAATLTSAVLLLWTGSLIDRVELRRFAYVVTVGLALACVLMSGSNGIAMLFLAILGLRHLGQGLMSMAGTTTIVRYLDHQRGKANAISGIGYSLSEAVLPTLVIATLSVMTWRTSWIFWGALLLLCMPALTSILLRGHGQRHSDYLLGIANSSHQTLGGGRKQWTRSEVIRDTPFYLFLPALIAQPLLFTGFMFHQVHLVDAKGWDFTAWGSLYIAYAVVSTICKLVAGLLVDRFGAMRLVPSMCLPFGLGLAALAMSDSFVIAGLFMCLMGVSVGVYSTLASPFFAEMYGTLHLGSIKSLTTSVMVFATAIAPVAMGWLIDRGVSIEAMALGGAVYTILASGCALMGMRVRSLRTQALETVH
ncbi:MAG: MFS family permease [Halioglobus sp.]|jgi:MFS family permease